MVNTGGDAMEAAPFLGAATGGGSAKTTWARVEGSVHSIRTVKRIVATLAIYRNRNAHVSQFSHRTAEASISDSTRRRVVYNGVCAPGFRRSCLPRCHFFCS